MRATPLTVLLFFILFFPYCKKPNNPYYKLENKHEVSKSDLYDLSHPWHKRVFRLDEAHRDFALKINQIDNIQERTIPINPTMYSEFLDKMENIAEKEHSLIKKIKDKYIYGIYLCENLGSTGLTGFVYNKDGKPVGGHIILDAKYLFNTKANAWITEKEHTVFRKGESTLNIEIEKVDDDTPENAIDYILIHELGHIVSMTEGFLPDFQNKDRNFQGKDFSQIDWLSETKSNWDEKIWKRDQIRFYSNPTLSIDEAKMIYESLEHTPFPTLYGAINADDHFAESFVSYIHIYLKNKYWTLHLHHPKYGSLIFKNGIIQERCKKEREFIRQYLSHLEKAGD